MTFSCVLRRWQPRWRALQKRVRCRRTLQKRVHCRYALSLRQLAPLPWFQGVQKSRAAKRNAARRAKAKVDKSRDVQAKVVAPARTAEDLVNGQSRRSSERFIYLNYLLLTESKRKCSSLSLYSVLTLHVFRLFVPPSSPPNTNKM